MKLKAVTNEWSDAARAAALEARRRHDLDQEAEVGSGNTVGSIIGTAAATAGTIAAGALVMRSPRLIGSLGRRVVGGISSVGSKVGTKLMGTSGTAAHLAEVPGRGYVLQKGSKATRGMLSSLARQAALRGKLAIRKFK